MLHVLQKSYKALVLTLFLSTMGFSQEPISLEHSYRDLGDTFSTEVSVVEDKSAQLVFFNYELADRLGIRYPKDPTELSKWAKKTFAWKTAADFGFYPENTENPKIDIKIIQEFVRKAGGDAAKYEALWSEYKASQEQARFQQLLQRARSTPGDRKLMATFYYNGYSKTPGDALGDGRSLYLGECVGCGKSGQDLDISIKGVGVTPMAWTSDRSFTHSDGKMRFTESIDSMAIGEALRQIGALTTEDLLVFSTKAGALSVRVGNQFRPAHAAFFSDNTKHPKQYPASEAKKLRSWIVNRVLASPQSSPVGRAKVKEYARLLAKNLAHNCALMETWNIVHLQPSLGNFTLDGGFIDLASLGFRDNYDANLQYLTGSGATSHTLKDQTLFIRHIFEKALSNMNHFEDSDFTTGLIKEFRANFALHFTNKKWIEIARLMGLSEEQSVAFNKEDKRNLIQIYDELSLIGTEKGSELDKPKSAFNRNLLFQNAFQSVATHNSHLVAAEESVSVEVSEISVRSKKRAADKAKMLFGILSSYIKKNKLTDHDILAIVKRSQLRPSLQETLQVDVDKLKDKVLASFKKQGPSSVAAQTQKIQSLFIKHPTHSPSRATGCRKQLF